MAQQKKCVSCEQMLPSTAVNCVFCGATQPGGPTPAAKESSDAKSTTPEAPSLQGFAKVATGTSDAPASPVIGTEASEHKATMLGIPAADIQRAIDQREGSSGSDSYSVGAGEVDELAKTTMGVGVGAGVPEGRRTGEMAAPVAGQSADPAMLDAKTEIDAEPRGVVVGEGTAPPADDLAKTVMAPPSEEQLAELKAAAAEAVEKKRAEAAAAADEEDEKTDLDAPRIAPPGATAPPAGGEATLDAAPAAAPADKVTTPSSDADAGASEELAPTEHDMKVSEVDQRLRKASVSGASGEAAAAEPADAEAKAPSEEKEPEILHGEAAIQDAVEHADEGKVPFEAGEVGIAERKPHPPRGKAAARIGAILGGLLLIGIFTIPVHFGEDFGSVDYAWELLDVTDAMAIVSMLTFPIVGILALLFGFIPVPQGARGFILAVLGAAAVGLTVVTNIDAPFLFLVIPGGEGVAIVTGLLLLAGLVIEPAGLFARSAATDSTVARILAILGALLILASYLVPVTGDIPVLAHVESLPEAPAPAIIFLLPALLALGCVTVFANPSSTGGAGVVGMLFILWGLAALPVYFIDPDTADLGVILQTVRMYLPHVICLYFLTYGLGQMFAKAARPES